MTQQLSKVDRIEEKIDRSTAGGIQVTSLNGGAVFNSMNEVMEFAKLMSVSDLAIPKHLRGNPGACMAVCLQAVEWRMSPFSVANKTYSVNDRISYESQIIHAVIEMRAPITGMLRHKFSGDGPSRRCTVWAFAKGEDEPLEYTSPMFSEIQPKSSPLWKTKPDLQLFYNTSRDWARIYFPHIVLGVYSDDELRDSQPMESAQRAPVAMPKPVSPAVTSVATAASSSPAKDPFGQTIPKSAPVKSDEEAERIIQQRTEESRAAGLQPTDSEKPDTSEAESGATVNQETGEVTDDTDSAPTPVNLPDPCPVGWIMTQIMKQRPADMSEKDADARINTVLRLKLPRPWDKLSKDGKQHHWTEWQTKSFPWSDSK